MRSFALVLSASLLAVVYSLPAGSTDAALRSTLDELKQSINEAKSAVTAASTSKLRASSAKEQVTVSVNHLERDLERVRKEAFLDGLIAASPSVKSSQIHKVTDSESCSHEHDTGVSGQPGFCPGYEDYCDSDNVAYANYMKATCAKTCCDYANKNDEVEILPMIEPCCWKCNDHKCTAAMVSQTEYETDYAKDIDVKSGFPHGYTVGCIDGGKIAKRNPNGNNAAYDSGDWCVEA